MPSRPMRYVSSARHGGYIPYLGPFNITVLVVVYQRYRYIGKAMASKADRYVLCPVLSRETGQGNRELSSSVKFAGYLLTYLHAYQFSSIYRLAPVLP